MSARSRRATARQRLVGAWLGLALILANTLLGPALSQRMMAPADDGSAICSIHGIRLVGSDLPANPGDQAPDQHGACAYCLALSCSGFAALPAGETVLPPPPSSGAVILARGTAETLTALPDKGRRARAPPAAA